MAATTNPSLTQRAVQAAVAVAARHGLRCDRPIVLHDRSNVLVHLCPAPVVARVATTTASVRHGPAWLAREVAVASHLYAAGAPVVPPSTEVAPGPHDHDGLVLSFWEFVDEIDEPPDPGAAGRALRQCHEALASFTGELPVLGAVTEAQSILARLVAEDALDRTDAAMLERVGEQVTGALDRLGLPMQPLHGDAHLRNALSSRRGPLWCDLEDTFRGPIGWDLGCLVSSARVLGTDTERAAAALAGYHAAIDDEQLELFVDARTFQAVVWGMVIARQHPQMRDRVEARLRWLRERERFVS